MCDSSRTLVWRFAILLSSFAVCSCSTITFSLDADAHAKIDGGSHGDGAGWDSGPDGSSRDAGGIPDAAEPLRIISSSAGIGAGSAASDPGGDLYVLGNFSQTVDLGTGVMTSPGVQGIFLARYRPDLSVRWAKAYVSTGLVAGSTVILGGDGNLYLAAYGSDTVDFDTGDRALGASQKALYLSLDTQGNERWIQSFGGAGNVQAFWLAQTSTTGVLVGQYDDDVDFGGGLLGATDTHDSGFVAVFDPGPVHRWSRGFPSIVGSYVWTITAVVDSSNGIVVGGTFCCPTDFGGGAVSPAGGCDAFLVAYTAAGAFRWQKLIGSTGDDNVFRSASAANGDILAAGRISGPADFGDGVKGGLGGKDAFILRVSSTGSTIWSRVVGGAGDDWSSAVVERDDGSVILGGGFRSQASFGTDVLISLGGSDIFLLTLSAGGSPLSTRSIGGSLDDGVGFAVPDPVTGQLWLGGSLGGVGTIAGQAFNFPVSQGFLIRADY